MRRWYAAALVMLLAPAARAQDAPEALLPAGTQIYLRWDGTPPKAGVIQQFKDNFDLDALRGLLQ